MSLQPENPTPEGRDTHRQNMVTLVFVGGMILLIIWLVNGYDRFLKMEKCIESRRQNCAPVEIPKS